MFIIKFNSNPPTYYDGSRGDPGRTTKIARAKRYGSSNSALRAAAQLRRLYNLQWVIVQIHEASGVISDDLAMPDGYWTPQHSANDEVTMLRKLMAEAVRDFHGKSVLFSSAFLREADKA